MVGSTEIVGDLKSLSNIGSIRHVSSWLIFTIYLLFVPIHIMIEPMTIWSG